MTVTPDDDLASDWGWISPGGTFYSCGHHEHTELAEALLLKRGTPFDDPDLTLEKLRWIKVGRISRDSGLAVAGHPNFDQLETLTEWARRHGMTVEDLQQF